MLARVVDALWHNIAGAVLTSTLQPHDGLSIVNCDVFFARHVKATKSILMSREQTAVSVTQERVQRDATVRLPFLSVVASCAACSPQLGNRQLVVVCDNFAQLTCATELEVCLLVFLCRCADAWCISLSATPLPGYLRTLRACWSH